MQTKRILTLLTAFAVCLGAASSAYADDDRRGYDHDRGRDHGRYDNYHYDRYDNYGRDYRYNDHKRVVYKQPRTIVIHPSDRVVIHDYMYARPVVYRPVARPAWRVGYRLPHYIEYRPIPPRLLNRLHRVPMGYEYVRVDNDILLISEATRVVIDAVTRL